MQTTLLAALAIISMTGAALYTSVEQTSPRMLSSQALATELAWKSWKMTHGKSYGTNAEEEYRLNAFTENMKLITEHNNTPGETYTMALNKFADLTNDEFRKQYLGLKINPSKERYNIVEEEEPTDYPILGDVNWVTKGKVQKVKNQGQCGSCWAFSTVASSESANAIYKNTLGDFSEQQLVDCSDSYGNKGCKGGLMDNGFAYFKDHGICTEESYPYTAKNGTCQAKKCTKDSFKISGHTGVQKGSTSSLKAACDKQPVSVAVDARKWQSYKSGIFNSCSTSLDHGVLLAGYTSQYWLIKNSWGAGWGEQGYIRLAQGNTCGLANEASYPQSG